MEREWVLRTSIGAYSAGTRVDVIGMKANAMDGDAVVRIGEYQFEIDPDNLTERRAMTKRLRSRPNRKARRATNPEVQAKRRVWEDATANS